MEQFYIHTISTLLFAWNSWLGLSVMLADLHVSLSNHGGQPGCCPIKLADKRNHLFDFATGSKHRGQQTNNIAERKGWLKLSYLWPII